MRLWLRALDAGHGSIGNLAKGIRIVHASFERSGLRETEDEGDFGWSVRIGVHRQMDTDVRRAFQVQSEGLMVFSELR